MSHLELCKQTFDTIGLKYEEESSSGSTSIKTDGYIDEEHIEKFSSVTLWFNKNGEFFQICAGI